jgi:hypothetical protein
MPTYRSCGLVPDYETSQNPAAVFIEHGLVDGLFLASSVRMLSNVWAVRFEKQ